MANTPPKAPLTTEADAKRTANRVREGVGQRISQERGSHTNNKKSPGKRAHQGGG